MTRKEYCVAIAEGDIAKVKRMSKRHLLGSAKRKKIPTLGCFSIDTRDNCRCWKSKRLTPRGQSRSFTDRIAFPENKSLLAMVCAKKCYCIVNGKQAQQKKVVTPLHVACYYGKVEVVRYLLKKDVTALNVNQFLSPLMMASLCKREVNALNIVTMLIEAGADLEATDDVFQYTALHLAVIKNRPKLVELMLCMGCNVNPLQCRLSPLFVAARNKCSKILLDHGANVLSKWEPYCPLQDAIEHDDVEAVRRYVSSPTFRPRHWYKVDEQRILHTVVTCSKEIRRLEMIDILLNAGVNIESTSEPSFPMDEDDPSYYEDFDMDLHDQLYGPPSFFAVAKGRVDVLERLLSLGSNVNFTNQDGLTPLMFASYARPPSVISAVISVLLKYGADVNARDRWGRSALFYLLCSEYADILHTRSEYTKSAYTESVTESTKLLLNAGAEMNILCISLTAPREESLLWHACDKGAFQCVDLFISYGLYLKRETWLSEMDRHPKKLTQNHEKLQYLLGEFRKVEDLKVICRRQLHNLLGKAIVCNIGCLGLPAYLKDYLLYT